MATYDPDENCGICGFVLGGSPFDLEELGPSSPFTLAPCSHTFHSYCIERWNQPHCAICRKAFSLPLRVRHFVSLTVECALLVICSAATGAAFRWHYDDWQLFKGKSSIDGNDLITFVGSYATLIILAIPWSLVVSFLYPFHWLRKPKLPYFFILLWQSYYLTAVDISHPPEWSWRTHAQMLEMAFRGYCSIRLNRWLERTIRGSWTSCGAAIWHDRILLEARRNISSRHSFGGWMIFTIGPLTVFLVNASCAFCLCGISGQVHHSVWRLLHPLILFETEIPSE